MVVPRRWAEICGVRPTEMSTIVVALPIFAAALQETTAVEPQAISAVLLVTCEEDRLTREEDRLTREEDRPMTSAAVQRQTGAAHHPVISDQVSCRVIPAALQRICIVVLRVSAALAEGRGLEEGMGQGWEDQVQAVQEA